MKLRVILTIFIGVSLILGCGSLNKKSPSKKDKNTPQPKCIAPQVYSETKKACVDPTNDPKIPDCKPPAVYDTDKGKCVEVKKAHQTWPSFSQKFKCAKEGKIVAENGVDCIEQPSSGELFSFQEPDKLKLSAESFKCDGTNSSDKITTEAKVICRVKKYYNDKKSDNEGGHSVTFGEGGGTQKQIRVVKENIDKNGNIVSYVSALYNEKENTYLPKYILKNEYDNNNRLTKRIKREFRCGGVLVWEVVDRYTWSESKKVKTKSRLDHNIYYPYCNHKDGRYREEMVFTNVDYDYSVDNQVIINKTETQVLNTDYKMVSTSNEDCDYKGLCFRDVGEYRSLDKKAPITVLARINEKGVVAEQVRNETTRDNKQSKETTQCIFDDLNRLKKIKTTVEIDKEKTQIYFKEIDWEKNTITSFNETEKRINNYTEYNRIEPKKKEALFNLSGSFMKCSLSSHVNYMPHHLIPISNSYKNFRYNAHIVFGSVFFGARGKWHAVTKESIKNNKGEEIMGLNRECKGNKCTSEHTNAYGKQTEVRELSELENGNKKLVVTTTTTPKDVTKDKKYIRIDTIELTKLGKRISDTFQYIIVGDKEPATTATTEYFYDNTNTKVLKVQRKRNGKVIMDQHYYY